MTAHRHDQDNLSVEQIEGIKAMKFNNNDANGSPKWRITILGIPYIMMHLNDDETHTVFGKWFCSICVSMYSIVYHIYCCYYVHGEYVCVFSIIIKSIVSSIIIFIDIHMRSISCLRANSIVLFNNGKSRWMQSHALP